MSGIMPKFVSGKLVTTRSFSPGVGEVPTKADGREAHAEPPPAAAPAADVDELLRREEAAHKTEAIGEAARELSRRRAELMQQVHELGERTKRDLATIERVARELAGLPAFIPDTVPLAELRQAKRVVDQAAVELLRIETREPEGSAQQILHEVCSLSFRQLTKLGFGLGWPVAAALLAAGLVVALALVALFGG